MEIDELSAKLDSVNDQYMAAATASVKLAMTHGLSADDLVPPSAAVIAALPSDVRMSLTKAFEIFDLKLDLEEDLIRKLRDSGVCVAEIEMQSGVVLDRIESILDV